MIERRVIDRIVMTAAGAAVALVFAAFVAGFILKASGDLAGRLDAAREARQEAMQ